MRSYLTVPTRRPRPLLILLTFVTLVPVAGLLWLGGALIAQDRELAEKQLRDRLDREADLLVASIARDLTPPRFAGADTVDDRAEAPAALWAPAEAAEYRGANDTARAAYNALAKSHDPAIRAGAMLRLARTLRRSGRAAESLAIYDQMKSMDEVRVFDAPASLWAALARVTQLDEQEHHDMRDREAAAIRQDLARGRWRIDHPTFESAWMQVASPTVLGNGWCVLARERGIAMALTDAAGNSVVASGTVSGPSVARTPADSSIPWSLRISSLSPQSELAESAGRRGQLMLLLLLAAFLALSGAYFVARGVRRELAVAELQSTFVSAVSHEFRTPLTSMSHLIEILRDRPDVPPARRAQYYDALEQEASRLRRFVDQLLDFGRLEAGEQTYRLTATDPVTLVESVVAQFRGSSAVGDHRIDVVSPPGLQPIDVDPDAVALALQNLLENAAKYSPQGRPIRVDVHHDPQSDQVRIAVRDDGPGIPRDEQRIIFDRFVRGRAARESSVRGSGVGLALARQIVRAQGGDITVASEPGCGSTFSIALPASTSGITQ